LLNDHHSISMSTSQKPMNLYLYRPPSSSQPPSILFGLIYGTLYRFYWQNSNCHDFDKYVTLFFQQLQAHSHSTSNLSCLFLKAATKVDKSHPFPWPNLPAPLPLQWTILASSYTSPFIKPPKSLSTNLLWSIHQWGWQLLYQPDDYCILQSSSKYIWPCPTESSRTGYWHTPLLSGSTFSKVWPFWLEPFSQKRLRHGLLGSSSQNHLFFQSRFQSPPGRVRN
jgi:hypothetical protein